MAAFSNYAENAILDHLLRGNAVTSPSTVYLALITNAGSEAKLEGNNVGDEVSGAGYQRQAVDFTAPVSGSTDNDAAVSFSNMPEVTVSYVAVMDSDVGGNVLFYGALTTPRQLTAGDTLTIADGDLDISLD